MIMVILGSPISLRFDLGSSCFPVFVSVELVVVYVILSSLLIHRVLIVVSKKIEYNTSTHIGVYRRKKVVVIVLFVDTVTLTFGFIEDQ